MVISILSAIHVDAHAYWPLSIIPFILDPFIGSQIGSEDLVLGHQSHVILSLILLTTILIPHTLLLSTCHVLSPQHLGIIAYHSTLDV